MTQEDELAHQPSDRQRLCLSGRAASPEPGALRWGWPRRSLTGISRKRCVKQGGLETQHGAVSRARGKTDGEPFAGAHPWHHGAVRIAEARSWKHGSW